MKLIKTFDVARGMTDVDHSLYKIPLVPKGIEYYAAAIGGEIENLSFGFVDADGICAIVPCNSAQADWLSWYDFPIEIWLRPGLALDVLRRLARDLMGVLMERARSVGASRIQLREPSDPMFNRVLSAQLLGGGHVSETSYILMIDLAQDDDAILAGMRSGHRQQVRSGRAGMELVYVDEADPDRDRFDAFRLLHAQVAGRVTRPAESWDRMFDMVSTGAGDLSLSYWDGELLGGTLMLDAGSVSYYASGAYVRSHFNKPLAHYPVFSCIGRARARGCTVVHLGEVAALPGRVTEKERSINNFKIGFTSSAVRTNIWTVAVS